MLKISGSCLLGALIAQAPASAYALVNPLAGAGLHPSLEHESRVVPSCSEIPPIDSMVGVSHQIDNTSASQDQYAIQASHAYAKPLYSLASAVTVQTQAYLSSGRSNKSAAACAIGILDNWARADALAGSFNEVGLAQRRWVINAVAVDFLAIQDSSIIRSDQRSRVAAWLAKQGDAIMTSMGSFRNNHLYWGAAAVAAIAIATNDPNKLDWAVQQARVGLSQVKPDGALPLEMERQSLAMHYHVFALEPLVQIVGFAKVNGTDLTSYNNGALGRLVGLVLGNLADASGIARQVGVSQKFDGPNADDQSWMEQYYAVTGDRRVLPLLCHARPVFSGFLGGNTTLLYGAPLEACRG